jgi:hypothetical protein
MKTFIGIDWAGGENNKQLVNICIIKKKKKNTDVSYAIVPENEVAKQIATIEKLIDDTDADCIVADIGFGSMQCQVLQSRFGEKFKSCYYSSNPTKKMVYKSDTWMLTVDRDAFISEAMDLAGIPFKAGIPMPSKGQLQALNYAYIAMSCGSVK